MTPEQKEEDGEFALDVAAKDPYAFYETTFDAPFPLPKMDMVAIPDFAAGAMENWGLSHLSSSGPPLRREDGRFRNQGTSCRSGSARAGAPMVWQPGYDGLLGWALA